MSKFFSARKEKKRFSKKVLPIKTMTQEKTDCAQAHQIEVSHHEQLPSSTPAGGKTPLEANERKKAHAASRAKTSRTQKSTASKTPRIAVRAQRPPAASRSPALRLLKQKATRQAPSARSWRSRLEAISKILRLRAPRASPNVFPRQVKAKSRLRRLQAKPRRK